MFVIIHTGRPIVFSNDRHNQVENLEELQILSDYASAHAKNELSVDVAIDREGMLSVPCRLFKNLISVCCVRSREITKICRWWLSCVILGVMQICLRLAVAYTAVVQLRYSVLGVHLGNWTVEIPAPI